MAEHLIVGDVDVEIEIHAAKAAHAERVGSRRARDARRVHRHQERRDALAAQSRTGACEHDGDRCFFRVRDPHLPAADAVAAAHANGGGLLIGCVGPCVGFGEREGADPFAGGELAQPPFPLLILPRVGDDFGDERVGDRQRDGDRSARLRDGLHRERVAHVIAPEPAPRLGQRHAAQARAGGRVHHVGRVLAGLVDQRGARRHDLRRELFDLLLEGALFGSELEDHRFTLATKDAKARKPRNNFRHFVSFVISCLARQRSLRARRSKIGCSRSRVAARPSGSTRVSAIAVMKLVSPFHRGTRWTWR